MTPTSPRLASHVRTERLALGLVLLVVIGLPLAILAYRSVRSWRAPGRVIELTGRLPTADHGGWTPETIVLPKGARVRLRVTSSDVVHGFAIPKMGIDLEWIEPGKVKEVDFVADRAGRFTFLCTAWCTTGHWRMRGIIEVVDPEHPVASAMDVDPPQTDWVATGLDIDADHPGEFAPFTQPDAANGDALWQAVSPQPVADAMATGDPRLLSPSDAYALLASGPLGAPQAAGLSPAERWDVVAHYWHSRTSPEARATGKRLFERDCTGCHGLSGQGDGPGAEAIRSAAEEDPDGMAKAPVDFTDLAAQAGASDMHYYGKLVRGGMGTSMPYWATIFTEDELWALIAHLRSFAFAYPTLTE